MALLPSGIIYGTTGNNGAPTEKIGGVAANITTATTVTAGQPLTKVLPLTALAFDDLEKNDTLPVAASGTAHAYSAETCLVAGTFAYKQVQFIMRGGVTTQINGSANTTLSIGGNSHRIHRTMISNSAKGALIGTAVRTGYFRSTGVANQRTNWSTPPSTGDVTFKLPTDNGTDAADQGQFVTYKSVPGELVYMYGAIDPNQDDYASRA